MKTILATVTCFLSLVLSAQKTELIYLSGKDKDHTVQWDFFCTHGRNSGKWDKIEVPSNWELQGYGTYHYGKPDLDANEKGLYRYEFPAPENLSGKKTFIVFEGSMTDTEVKINGKIAGPVHQGAFYRFKYDISDLLNPGKKNIIEVTVSKESANNSINEAERTSDYWVFGGIFRPVYLEVVPREFIDRVAINARADGTFSMDVFIGGNGQGKTITAQVETLDGKPFGLPMKAAINDNKSVITGNFTDPHLWNPEFPEMYRVVVNLSKGKKVEHQIIQKFGFRTIDFKVSDGIYVNGTKIIFKGVCRHTFWPSSGRTSSKALAIEDVNLMKDMNMNAVRMSHYPPDQFFLDICDSLGLFVLDELAGWQHLYDTPTARRLVKEMVIRDVNHPSIILWDNGNEGGFNKEVREDYALYDPQKRTVIEPWSILNGTNTKHYPGYKYVEDILRNRNEVYFPTEFLHGLFDGGLGAGLDDYWNLMMSKPLAAGGFLWVFADEGVERKDLNDSIDTFGNRAPDGILGPYHEKEGSFYTIKEIWSPVVFSEKAIDGKFNGKMTITNRYLYTNLKSCKYSFELVKYDNIFPSFDTISRSGVIDPPDIAPGMDGSLNVKLPSDWDSYDVLYISVNDQYGRSINRWSWNIKKAEDFLGREVVADTGKVIFSESDSSLMLGSGKTTVFFNKKNGLIGKVIRNGKQISFSSGPQFQGVSSGFTGLKHYLNENTHVIEILYEGSCHTRYEMLSGGCLKLEYDYIPDTGTDFSGITFGYPENLVTGAVLLSNGPYHVWKNRLKGVNFGIFNKEYNNTGTGETWVYPEFKGYYSNFYAVQIKTLEVPITIVTKTDGLFLHLFTPAKPRFSIGGVNPPFPSGNISVLSSISPIGTKFSKSENEGPQGMKNLYASPELVRGTLFISFGDQN